MGLAMERSGPLKRLRDHQGQATLPDIRFGAHGHILPSLILESSNDSNRDAGKPNWRARCKSVGRFTPELGQEESNSINLVEDCGNGSLTNPAVDDPR